ncbi:hypothetical protein CQW23_10188 [Capsicum baccatum]|uniref:NADH:quinone oxidoreductase/Mrp antiporter transmembrane domain-containing protein n=1 Tax=Capsicum baccatum TaxID=33114 RepID=A0A2G2WZ24_CAPBA|nr:hypothetical protein CQW23_10188 [Capsicum baccatum]
MPRRIPDYLDAYVGWNTLSSFGSYISVVGICRFFVVETITSSRGKNKRCAPSPWDVEQNPTTPEWMVQSPPAFHTFGELPAIKETKSYVKYTKKDVRSNEATMKYLLMGGASSSILVHSFSWLYGSSWGEIELQEIVNGLINTQMYNSPRISIALIFITVGIGFKLSLAPSHQWTPEAYERVRAFFDHNKEKDQKDFDLSETSYSAGNSIIVDIFTNAFENFEWSISSSLDLNKLSLRERLLSKMNLDQIPFFELRKLAMLVLFPSMEDQIIIGIDLHGEWIENPTHYTWCSKGRETIPIKIHANITYDELAEIIISRFELTCDKDDLSISYMLGFVEKQKGAPSKIRDDRDLHCF